MIDIDREFIPAADAATILGVPKRTLLYWLSRGIMHGTLVGGRLWLVPRAEVERWRGVPNGQPREHQQDGPDAASTGSGPGEPTT